MENPRFHLTDQERILGHQIVVEELGDGFTINYDLYPHNKGIKGDEGVFGETVEIEMLGASLLEKIKFQIENTNLLAQVSARITNALPSVTKVLFNVATEEDKS